MASYNKALTALRSFFANLTSVSTADATEMQFLARVFANSHEGLIVLDARERLIAVNQAFTRITGYVAEDVLGQPLTLLSPDHSNQSVLKKMRNTLQRRGRWRGELWSRRKNGESYPQWIAINTMTDAGGEATYYVGLLSDITERKLVERRMRYLAHHDALTQLPNRLLLQDRINQALSQAERHQHPIAILFLDLDRFKVINDSLGHDIGDLLLKAVAERMLACVRAEDTVARQGGDEFVVLLPNLQRTEDAAIVARKLSDALIQAPFNCYGHELHITASIGISAFPNNGEDALTLLKNADTALHHAKDKGRDTYAFFGEDMNSRAHERLALENNLRRAMARHEFFLNYQPQLDIQTGRLIGLEVLIRWKQPEQGLVSPTKFIPIAEEIGLIEPIGEWMLRAACQQHRRWRDAGFEGLRIAVNLSARQFRQSNILEMIKTILEETQMPPTLLELELTEGMLMQHTRETLLTLDQLKDLGLQLAIDDFGTGYSSLSYLKRFPIHKLKIDQSFVRDVVIDADDAAIVSAIIAMAHGLKLKVVAEGVESAEQLAFLRERRCDTIQGYYLSPPLSAEAFTDFLQNFPATPR